MLHVRHQQTLVLQMGVCLWCDVADARPFSRSFAVDEGDITGGMGCLLHVLLTQHWVLDWFVTLLWPLP